MVHRFFETYFSKNITIVNNGIIELQKLYLDAPIEKLQLQCLHNILGLPNKCTRIAILGEMGQYPVLLQCFLQMVKNWHRLETSAEENMLVTQAFLSSKCILAEENYNWLSNVRAIVNHCGLLDAWNNPSNFKCKQLVSMCKRRLQKKFLDY